MPGLVRFIMGKEGSNRAHSALTKLGVGDCQFWHTTHTGHSTHLLSTQHRLSTSALWPFYLTLVQAQTTLTPKQGWSDNVSARLPGAFLLTSFHEFLPSSYYGLISWTHLVFVDPKTRCEKFQSRYSDTGTVHISAFYWYLKNLIKKYKIQWWENKGNYARWWDSGSVECWEGGVVVGWRVWTKLT